MARTLAISYSDVISSFWLSFASPPNFAEDRRLVLWGFPFLYRSLPVLPRFDANLCLKTVGCFPPISTSGDGFAFEEPWSNNGESGRRLEQHSKFSVLFVLPLADHVYDHSLTARAFSLLTPMMSVNSVSPRLIERWWRTFLRVGLIGPTLRR